MKVESFIKFIIVSILLTLTPSFFGQKKVDRVLKADSICFCIKTIGCFGGGTNTITIVKQLNDSLKVTLTDSEGWRKFVKIDKAQFVKFSETYKAKMNGKKCGCTITSYFSLRSKNGRTKFKTRCCGEELPSKTFKKILMLQD